MLYRLSGYPGLAGHAQRAGGGVTIDGKTLRGPFDRGRAQLPLHLVSAWASARGVVLGRGRTQYQVVHYG